MSAVNDPDAPQHEQCPNVPLCKARKPTDPVHTMTSKSSLAIASAVVLMVAALTLLNVAVTWPESLDTRQGRELSAMSPIRYASMQRTLT